VKKIEKWGFFLTVMKNNSGFLAKVDKTLLKVRIIS
jgi:hypothetical protein